MTRIFSLLVATVLLAAPAVAAEMIDRVAVAETEKGPALTDEKRMSLYIFDNDSEGRSTCYGRCAESWPPLLAEPGATPTGDFTLIEREDGGRQWAYKGKPLYGWVRDKQPGDATGHGFRDVWHLARP